MVSGYFNMHLLLLVRLNIFLYVITITFSHRGSDIILSEGENINIWVDILVLDAYM